MHDWAEARLGLRWHPLPEGAPRIGGALTDAGLPAVPDEVNWHQGVDFSGPDGKPDALGNLGTGLCVPAGVLRQVQIMRRVVAGDLRKPTGAQAAKLYLDWSKNPDGSGGWDGVPGSPSDLGTRSDLAAARWMSGGVEWGPSWKDWPILAGFEPVNLEALRAAVAWLGPCQLDLALPLQAKSEPRWDAWPGPAGAPGGWGYHRVCTGRFDWQAGLWWLVTWGEEVVATDAFVAKYAVDATSVVTGSWIGVQDSSPLGLNVQQLGAAWRKVGYQIG